MIVVGGGGGIHIRKERTKTEVVIARYITGRQHAEE
jgi:hypothetical protein